jgi:predicted unusual protein kinase regulating ubiquinone biosynthesis (AarF/ABC1/UbiB family)
VAPDINAIAREAAARIREEIDYRHEARMIATFSELYRDHPFIRVPEVIDGLSRDRALTMTFVPGMSWSSAQTADQDLKDRWAEIIMRFIYGNFRHANLLWADPHPGNYLFNADGTVGFVDFGCVKTLPEPPRRQWVAMVRAAIEGRHGDTRRLMAQIGYFGEHFPADDKVLAAWWGDLLAEYIHLPQPVTYTAQNTARIINASFSVDVTGSRHRIRVPDDFALYPRVHLALSSVCAGLNATLPARAIADDLDAAAPPVTELGALHHQWVRRRGLPQAMDSHERD